MKCYYTPAVTTTLIDENAFYGPTKKAVNDFNGMAMFKFNGPQTWSVICAHASDSTKDVYVHGIMKDKKSMFTHPFIVPDLDYDHPYANIHTSSVLAEVDDDEFRKDVDAATNHRVYMFQEQLQEEVMKLRDKFIAACDVNDDDAIQEIADFPYHKWIQDQTPINSIR